LVRTVAEKGTLILHSVITAVICIALPGGTTTLLDRYIVCSFINVVVPVKPNVYVRPSVILASPAATKGTPEVAFKVDSALMAVDTSHVKELDFVAV
jgi:hypothetical protein